MYSPFPCVKSSPQKNPGMATPTGKEKNIIMNIVYSKEKITQFELGARKKVTSLKTVSMVLRADKTRSVSIVNR